MFSIVNLNISEEITSLEIDSEGENSASELYFRFHSQRNDEWHEIMFSRWCSSASGNFQMCNQTFSIVFRCRFEIFTDERKRSGDEVVKNFFFSDEIFLVWKNYVFFLELLELSIGCFIVLLYCDIPLIIQKLFNWFFKFKFQNLMPSEFKSFLFSNKKWNFDNFHKSYSNRNCKMYRFCQ